ncbi:carbohydrate kinase [Avibacterium sp. 21-595]|uniref:FGGY-family carbohydrate kinase n=1 Tax=Avibacterium sp. 21-595 TaxID=2911527 RepID=UPI002025DA45|nr:FGGY-family carbohydrate kinase [Avibacterium sp. 21-595]URL06760.1 carbohydrate kinase [Avibacterium sp. 21-595]
MDYYLGIDCGGTFIKAALFDAKGKMFACIRENVPVISEQAGYAERDMTHLWQVCANVIKKTITQSEICSTHIKGVGISAQGKGVFLLDQQNAPLGRAILSSDQRALEIVRQWQQAGIPEKLYPHTRQTLWTGHPVSILRWLKDYEPERYHNIGAILMSHDYLRFCLTGELACEETNISESNLYNMQTQHYDPQLAEMLGLDHITEKLPPIVKANQIAGYVNAEAAKLTGLAQGTPVVGGLFDVVSTALCAGLDDETKLNIVLGTWSVVSGVTDHIDDTQHIPFVYGRYAQKGKFIIHEASPTSAGNLEWFVKEWGNLSYQTINDGVAALPVSESAVLFVPFLYGSNAGLGMKSGFYGIQAHHNKMHLFQAIYEGVLFSMKYHLDRMLQRFPHPQVLRITGGPAKSQVWMQMLADLTGMKIEVPEIEETGCLGAAMMAMEGTRGHTMSMTAKQQCFIPNSQNFAIYQKKYQRYQQFVSALQALL